jgi:hypothetical protein
MHDSSQTTIIYAIKLEFLVNAHDIIFRLFILCTCINIEKANVS